MSDEADRLIAAALRDHARMPAPPQLRRKLARRYAARGTRRWLLPSFTAVAGAALAAVVLLLVRPAPSAALLRSALLLCRLFV